MNHVVTDDLGWPEKVISAI